MSVTIFGINHKTAPISVREKVAFAPDKIVAALVNLRNEVELEEVVIISTCNRMEVVYKGGSKPNVANWLAKHHQMSVQEIDTHSYSHSGREAVSHLMSVASGLDSMVLGEPQILGQVKDAFGYANNAGCVDQYLNRLFQQTFTLAKQVRTNTQIGESAVSIAYAAVTLSKRIFSDFERMNALFIGAGDTIELAAKHLVRQGVTNINVANRTVERAEVLASKFGGTAHSLSALSDLVEHADIIISSTASPVPIIGKGLMEKAMIARKFRAVFMVDLAVPRDIEAEVSKLNNVYLYTVDDMQGVIQENLKVREEAAREAKEIVQLHTEKYLTWLKSLSSVSMLKEFRTQMDEIKVDEIKRAIAKLEPKDAADNQQTEKIIEELANRLAQKFMHQPSKEIRRAGENNDAKTLETLANTFDLKR